MCVDPIGRAEDNQDILLDKDGLLYMFDFIREKRLEGKMNVTYEIMFPLESCRHYSHALSCEKIMSFIASVPPLRLYMGPLYPASLIVLIASIERCPSLQTKIVS